MKYKQKVVILLPYFGKWPSYFNLFLKGCENNPEYHFLFFTDCPIPNTIIQNVKYIPFSLTEFSHLASQKLELNLKVEKAYKLCDYRPAFGKIFEDYINKYDYWGYGDIDLIYGDLSSYIKPKLDKQIDVISNRSEILSGSLTLLRNTDYINNLFLSSPTYLEKIQLSENYGLDETAFDHSSFIGNSKLNLPKYSFTYMIANEAHLGNLTASFESTCEEELKPNDYVHYRNGKLTFNNKSLSYYHYVCNKNKLEYHLPEWDTVPLFFFIRNTGFYKHNENLKTSFIHYYRITTGILKKIIRKLIQ